MINTDLLTTLILDQQQIIQRLELIPAIFILSRT